MLQAAGVRGSYFIFGGLLNVGYKCIQNVRVYGQIRNKRLFEEEGQFQRRYC